MSARILIVEDNADNMKLITWVLEDEEYDVKGTTTAEEALDMLENESFDLVLMDISLPGMDGKEATRRLRADSKFESLPIIAVTAHAVKGEAEQIMASGVSALATKPINEEELVQTIKSYLNTE